MTEHSAADSVSKEMTGSYGRRTDYHGPAAIISCICGKDVTMANDILSGITVLDFTSNLAGPSAGALLADLGARVIHIEKPVTGDDNRNWADQVDGTCTSHIVFNRSKESVTINLKDPEGRRLALELARTADVLIESTKPGSMEKLGLGYETVHKINPRIVYCSISAYGHTGPYSAKPGYDVISQAYSGFMYYTTPVENGSPTLITPTIADYIAGINAYGNILAALYDREHSGKGQHVDIALTRSLLFMWGAFSHPYTGRLNRKRSGNVNASLCPYGLFKYDDDNYVAIGAANNTLYKKFCVAMNRPDMAENPDYATVPQRARHVKEIYAEIERWLQSFDSLQDAIDVLNEHGVANSKVNSLEDLEKDPHALAARWIREIPTPDSVTSRPMQLAAVGIADFSEHELCVRKAPDLGQHNYKVLGELGLSRDEIDALQRKWAEGM